VGAKGEVVTFFRDASGTYGAPRPGRRLPESVKLRREIEQLNAQKWNSPDMRDELDAMIEQLWVRVARLEAHPEEDLSP
jgi:hypothetical protein